MDQTRKGNKVFEKPKPSSDRGRRKDESETTKADITRKKSHRGKDKLKISSYSEASEVQESTLSLRLNHYPLRALLGRERSRSSNRRLKSKSTPEKAAERNGEGPGKTNPTEIEVDGSSVENVLSRSRESQSTDARRNETVESVSEEELINQTTSDSQNKDKKGRHLLRKASPIIDSYFMFKSSPWQTKEVGQELQTAEIESPKANINQILRGHAQKESDHSLHLDSTLPSEFLPKMRMIRKEKSSTNPTKNVPKVIDIQTSKESKKPEERAAIEKKAEKKAAKETPGEVKDEEKKILEVNEKDRKQEMEEKEAEKIDQREDFEVGEEKEMDSIKRVTYTDRLLLNRFKRDSADKLKNPGAIIASVIEKLNNPFKNELQKKLEICFNGEDVGKKSEEPTKQKIALSDAGLKTTVQKQRSAREATIDDQVNKSVEQLSKTKCARSLELRGVVSQAIKEHKIFCIFDNHWYIVRPVRDELLSRGWLEVIPDRRLIPRRRPPPAGPAVDRITSADYAMEAILTAREAFVDDYMDVMAKFPPVKITPEKPKSQRKFSEESLKEVNSDFRIVPPAPDKKKNNQDIRDFVGRCQYSASRKQTIQQEKDKKWKFIGKTVRTDKQNTESNPEGSILTTNTSSLANKEDVVNSAEQNRKFIAQLPMKEKTKDEPRVDEVEKANTFLSESDAKLASKIIQSSNARIHFMWLSIKPAIHLKCFNYSPEIVNKFQKTTFCTKIGLWSHLNNIQWYSHEVTFPAKSPRMYNTGEADDLQAFFQDFQMTACIGILKWLSETFFEKGVKGVQKKKGKVPIKAFEFAIRQCERYIRFRENEDLNLLEDSKMLQEEWNTFLQWFYIITNDHGKLQETSNAQIMVVYTKAVEILRAMKRHWPEIDIDGRLNIWIMKPYCASCGRGIFMTNNVYYIGQHSKYIVQKYIERPLLIFNTKFDIRQWFMITKLVPLEIWMYKECYLRFCTQPFALRNLHESVHLSNNSVQKKYVNQKGSGLPDQNMWDSNTFQHYLKTIGQPNAWNEVIYPGMRDAIISLMLAAQDTFDNQRKSWFEVYGADFMISANLKDGPWLIEINESPAMDPSTKVTARLCPQMLRDVIKVVVDKRANKNASTGQWELIYRQNYSPSYGTISIDVKGKRIARAPPNKPGFTNNWSPPPFFFNSPGASKENTPEKIDGIQKYDIIKSYKTGLDNAKPSVWADRIKGKLIKEMNNSSIDKLGVRGH